MLHLLDNLPSAAGGGGSIPPPRRARHLPFPKGGFGWSASVRSRRRLCDVVNHAAGRFVNRPYGEGRRWCGFAQARRSRRTCHRAAEGVGPYGVTARSQRVQRRERSEPSAEGTASRYRQQTGAERCRIAARTESRFANNVSRVQRPFLLARARTVFFSARRKEDGGRICADCVTANRRRRCDTSSASLCSAPPLIQREAWISSLQQDFPRDKALGEQAVMAQRQAQQHQAAPVLTGARLQQGRAQRLA